MSGKVSEVRIETHRDSGTARKSWTHPGGKLIEEGSSSLRQDELLAILIGSGVRGRPALVIANAVLDEYIGLYGIYRQGTIGDLARISGLGNRKAARVLAAVKMGECVHRHLKESMSRNPGESDLFSSLEPSQTAASSHNHESEVRLLEAVVGSGIAGMSALAIANELISKYGSIMGLFGRDMGEFLAIKGLNSVKIIRIAAALEIAARVERALS